MGRVTGEALMTVSETEVTDEMLTAAMRAFELMSSVLRYREKDKWHSCDVMGMRDAIKAALAVRPAALSDQVVVPKEPTPKMIEAGCEANSTIWNDGTDVGFVADLANDIYRAMIAAAPPPASPAGEVVG
jgi:hypothetical protein